VCGAGSPDNSYTVTFEEPTGANPLVEMMMQVGRVCVAAAL
jgi:hypothetical protein